MSEYGYGLPRIRIQMYEIDRGILNAVLNILRFSPSGNKFMIEENIMAERAEDIQYKILHVLEHSLEVLERISHQLSGLAHPHHYSIHITQEKSMSTGITAGGSGQFGAALLDNGQLFTPPAGSTYVFVPTFSADDTTVTFSAATIDPSGGAIPLAAQTVVNVPAGDPGTPITITATATAPDGSMATGSLSVPVTAEAQQFTIAVGQLS